MIERGVEALPQVNAVLQSFLPGPHGGAALADALLGRFEPSGRLPISWPTAASSLLSSSLVVALVSRSEAKTGIHLIGPWVKTTPVECMQLREALVRALDADERLAGMPSDEEGWCSSVDEAVYKKAVVLMRNVAHDKALLAECMRLQVVVAPALPRCPANPRLETNRVFVEWEYF